MAALKTILSSRVSKWIGHTIATVVLSRSYCQTYSENPRVGFCLSTGRCTGAFLKRKVPDFVSSTLWSPNSWNLNPDDYNIWSVGLMQEKVHWSRIAKVNELEMCVIDEWGRFDQSIVDAATAASGAVVSALVSEKWSTLWAPNIQFQIFCHVSTKSY